MRIGVPREVKDGEFRVALTPAGVRALPDVVVEQDAGSDMGFSDDDYVSAGATLGDPWAMFKRGKDEGREVRGISDHKFIRSIYFRDPNGYVIELTAKRENHERAMDPETNRARRTLEDWQQRKA